ncbi:DUF3307 domain-containing protein [Streptomyces hoynatensis]|nr:DUF3307 domain-containing protein [Streptomyces hoynatensis]
MAEVFALLLVGHWLADYPGQTDRQAKRKAGWTEGKDDPHPGRHHHGWGANLTHAGTHVAICGVLLGIGAALLPEVTLHPAPTVAALAWIGATHSVIDRRWPVRWWMENTGQAEYLARGGAQHVDQAAHALALLVAAVGLAA